MRLNEINFVMSDPASDYLYYCKICRKSIFDKKKHYFTLSHKEKLEAFLEKKAKEYHKYKIFLEQVVLLTDLTEQPCFWCTFCEKEVNSEPITKRQKNVRIENLFACCQVFKHIASKSHKSEVDSFWNLNRPFTISVKTSNKAIDNNTVLNKECRFLKDEFILSKESLDKFISNCKMKADEMSSRLEPSSVNHEGLEEACFDFGASVPSLKAQREEHRYIKQKEIVSKASSQFKKFPTIMDEPFSKKMWTLCAGENDQARDIGPKLLDQTEVGIVNTIGLSRISVPSSANGEKNVFVSGNIPPWLKNAELSCTSHSNSSRNSNIIGPNIESFIRHKEIENHKARAKSTKLGFNFDHSQKIDSAWLPNFGRVWEEGSRFMSRLNYQHSKSDMKSKKHKII